MNYFLRAFTVATILALPLRSYAQTDTTNTQDTSEKSAMAWSEVVLAQGKKVQGYFSLNEAGLEKRIYYCATNPEVKPYPTAKFVNVDNIHSMTQRGHYSESLKIKGKSLHLLALRVVDGPVELFTFADPKSIPIPVPLPGAVLTPVFAIPYVNNHWYLRRNGELIEVRRGQFETQIADYVHDLPALAAKVRSKDKDYQYQDMIRIITEYNQQLATTK